jgi:hypothetical protein
MNKQNSWMVLFFASFLVVWIFLSAKHGMPANNQGDFMKLDPIG